jgi:hypothetical protein
VHLGGSVDTVFLFKSLIHTFILSHPPLLNFLMIITARIIRGPSLLIYLSVTSSIIVSGFSFVHGVARNANRECKHSFSCSFKLKLFCLFI